MDTLTAARPQPPLPDELTRLLTAAHAALQPQGEGQEGWWGTLTLPGHTHDVQARVTPDGLDLFLGDDLLFLRSEHARYVNHAALGLDPWDALRCLIDLENSALVLHGSDARWLLPVQDDFSVRGVGAAFMPHTAAVPGYPAGNRLAQWRQRTLPRPGTALAAGATAASRHVLAGPARGDPPTAHDPDTPWPPAPAHDAPAHLRSRTPFLRSGTRAAMSPGPHQGATWRS